MNGWLQVFKILASETAYFNYFFYIKLYFFRALIARIYWVALFLPRKTFPNAPVPKTFINSNSIYQTSGITVGLSNT